MKIVKSWRFVIKCVKLNSHLAIGLLCIGYMGITGLVFEIGNFVNGVGAFLLMAVAMYPVQLVYSLCGSQLVQSSPYKKTMMTSLPALLTFCSGILIYLLVIGIEGIRVMGNPDAVEYSTSLILVSGIMLMILDIYATVAYKYYAVSMVILIGFITGFYHLLVTFCDGKLVLPWITGISMPVAIAVGMCFAVLGNLLQYGVSLLVYKARIAPGDLWFAAAAGIIAVYPEILRILQLAFPSLHRM